MRGTATASPKPIQGKARAALPPAATARQGTATAGPSDWTSPEALARRQSATSGAAMATARAKSPAV